LGDNIKIIDTEALLVDNDGGGLDTSREKYIYVVVSLECRPKSEDNYR
jgi:hypothetical protein